MKKKQKDKYNCVLWVGIEGWMVIIIESDSVGGTPKWIRKTRTTYLYYDGGEYHIFKEEILQYNLR